MLDFIQFKSDSLECLRLRVHLLDIDFPQANDTLAKVLEGKPLIDPGEIDGLLEDRYAFINLWRSFSNTPVQVGISIDPPVSECMPLMFRLAPAPSSARRHLPLPNSSLDSPH